VIGKLIITKTGGKGKLVCGIRCSFANRVNIFAYSSNSPEYFKWKRNEIRTNYGGSTNVLAHL
jgi:hypothetical protein